MTDTIDLGKFPLGKNNIAKETSLPEGSLRDAINVDTDDEGNTRLREGYTQIYAGSDIDSLYKRFFREGNTLKYLNDDNSTIDVVEVSASINYTEVNGLIYWTDGSVNGVISGFVNRSLSTPTPSLVGNTPQDGDIQITYAYRDQVTGEIGGAPLALANATSYSRVGYDLVKYQTTGDDGRLYDSAGNICQTQFLESLPAGQILEYYKGKLYVAKGSALWFSEPHRYGLTRPSKNFFNFPSRITITIAVDSGIFVVADKTYFIAFNKSEDSQLREVSQDKAVEGTGLLLLASDLELEGLGDTEVAYWFGDKGAMVGLPDGTVQNVTKNRLAIADNTSQIGASLYKEINGIKQLISTMPQGDVVSRFQASDSATLTIYRDGILVE